MQGTPRSWPFVETSAGEELAGGSDAANPADAESEPWPRPVSDVDALSPNTPRGRTPL
jgi:hypothetical protein